MIFGIQSYLRSPPYILASNAIFCRSVAMHTPDPGICFKCSEFMKMTSLLFTEYACILSQRGTLWTSSFCFSMFFVPTQSLPFALSNLSWLNLTWQDLCHRALFVVKSFTVKSSPSGTGSLFSSLNDLTRLRKDSYGNDLSPDPGVFKGHLRCSLVACWHDAEFPIHVFYKSFDTWVSLLIAT